MSKECSICLSVTNSKTRISLECEHIFHAKCIQKWILVAQKNNKTYYTCPTCRMAHAIFKNNKTSFIIHDCTCVVCHRSTNIDDTTLTI